MPSLRNLALPSSVAVAALLAGSTAHAADITTTLGIPGDPTWTAACTADPQAPAPQVPPAAGYPFDCASWPAWAEPLCLHRVDISAASFPLATCSDGTPASFYIRAGSDPDRWVIHLEGGGGCTDETECRERWCGQQGLYDASLMSSDWDGDGLPNRADHIAVQGISQVAIGNAFNTWNHVFVPYCSSDAFLGRASDVDLGDFTVDARGHTIVRAVRSMLRSPGWTAVDGYTVPDLDGADEIVFAGTSAGGFGAVQNADWFLGPLSARSGLVIDGAIDVSTTAILAHDVWADNAGINYYSHRFELDADKWDPGGYLFEIDAFVDETCRGHYEPIGMMNRCTSPSLMLRLALGGVPLVETPTFIRSDLEDIVLSDWFTEDPNPDGDTLLVGGSNGTAATLADYRAMIRETLVELAADAETDITVHATRCGTHVGLQLQNAFMVATTPDSTDVANPVSLANPSTFHDALLQWFVPGGAFTRFRRIDTHTGARFSSC